MNSREKGKRGERLWRDEMRAQGYAARRGQQFSGSPDSPDVVCPALPWLHFEVKCVERLNIEEAMDQARLDARQAQPAPTALRAEKIPIVAHKRNHCRWLVTMDAETFFRFLRGDLPVQSTGALGTARPTNNFKAAACAAAINQNNKPTEGRGPANTNETESQ
jgi:hypothetical protein